MTRALVTLLVVAGCDVERPIGSNVDASTPQWTYVAMNVTNKVDFLFVVDNSYGMDAMQEELRARFARFFKVFQDLADNGTFADLHIGVITTDYGAGSTGAPGCQPSPGGQLGRLQAIGNAAAANCAPPTGANFVRYNFADGGADNNLPIGQDLVATFNCMTSIGTAGCGFEHTLEAAYVALHDNLPENAGFLRDDALLTVVFFTNEDDSSAPPQTRLFDATRDEYGFLTSFRSTRYGVVCGDGTPLRYGASGGPLADCRPAPNPPGLLYDVQRYIGLFTRPAVRGGIKPNPADVVVIAIDGPTTPFEVILSNPGTLPGTPYVPCNELDEHSNPPCVPVLQHSCQNPQQPRFFADPPVRLNAVVNSAINHGISSVCDSDYTGALMNMANLLVSNIGGGCVPYAFADPDAPACVAEDVTENADGTTTVTEIPRCTEPRTALPCWLIEKKDACVAVSPQGLGLTVDRNHLQTPPNTYTRYHCS